MRLAVVYASAALLASAVPALAADPEAGRTKAAMCAVCHGLDGIGKNPDVPNIAGDPAIYTEAQLRAFRAGERKHEQMSIIAQTLKDEDIADLAAWYSGLKVTVEVPQ